MKNILIGVGGTGAKTVEAALVLLAAGGVEGPVYVGLVDQDEANGNVRRTRDLLSRMTGFRERWGPANQGNHISWSVKDAPALGSIDVRPLFERPEAKPTWPPNPRGHSLKDIIGGNLAPAHRQLFDLLFMNDRHEQDLPLGKGYRGRAHVGSAAMVASIAGSDNEFITRMMELMRDDQHGNVNIFMVGSSFGGTGAAGFPTLARKLHRMRTNADPGERLTNGDKIALGGLLLLPYFSFANPDEESDAVVTADELLPKAQLALEYYENLFRREGTFDRFYVMGWNPLFALGYHEPGSEEQQNPALPAELVAATAAIDFFRRMEEPDSDEDEVKRLVSVRKGDHLDWADLPDRKHADPAAPKLEDRLAQMLRFAAYWRYHYVPLLKKPVGFFGKVMGDSNWASELADKADASLATQQLEALDALLRDILHWAATVEHMALSQGRNGCWRPGLWSLRGLQLSGYDPGEPDKFTRPVLLDEPEHVAEARFIEAFNALYRTDSGEPSRRNAGVIHEEVKGLTMGPEHIGIGRAVAAIYHACRIKD